MKVKEESEKGGLKLNVQKTKIIASSPITPWKIDGGNSRNKETLFFAGGGGARGIPKSLQMVIAAMK